MLGWKIIRNGEYVLDLPALSPEEEKVVLAVEAHYREKVKTEGQLSIEKLLHEHLSKNRIYADKKQFQYLCKASEYFITGFHFLTPLLKDDEIEEISIIGPKLPAYVYLRNLGWKQVNAAFTSQDAISEAINRLSRSIGRRITLQNPRLDAVLPDGSRLHASLPPVSSGEISIRKFRQNPFTPNELYRNSTLDLDSLVTLSFLFQGDYSVLVCGNTASGKTTTLNSLFSFVPLTDRVLITEETPEINIPHSHQIRLLSNREMGITLSDLVYDSLRMRPDRTIVGEVRNKVESEALIDILLGGQARGTYATFHARSAKEALQRLKSFGTAENDLGSIDVIIVQRRMLVYDPKTKKNYEKRAITEITDSSLNDIKGGSFQERIASDFSLSRKEFAAEFAQRKRFLSINNRSFIDSFRNIQKNLYGLDYAEKDG